VTKFEQQAPERLGGAFKDIGRKAGVAKVFTLNSATDDSVGTKGTT